MSISPLTPIKAESVIYQYVRRGRQRMDRPWGDDQDRQVHLQDDGTQPGQDGQVRHAGEESRRHLQEDGHQL